MGAGWMTIDAAITSGGAKPTWVLACFIAGMAGIGVSGIPIFFTSVPTPTARWLHWGGWLCAAAFFGIGASFRGWPTSVPIIGLCLFLALLRAYFSTPYLKVGGRVISFFPHPDEPGGATNADGDGYSQISANKIWWVIAVVCWLVGSAPLIAGWTPALGLGLAILAFIAFVAGTDDSSRALPLVRGQRPQAIAACIGLLPVFAVPVIAYLVGFRIGRNRPATPGRHSADSTFS